MREGRFASLGVKLAWTALFFVLFLAGRSIPLTLLSNHATATTNGINTDLLNAANLATGGDFFSPSLFSLGLGPWMSAAILWRFLFIGKLARGRRIPVETENRARYVLIVILAVIQAISMMASYELQPGAASFLCGELGAQAAVVVILVAGALVVAWLATLNERLGLGGITMFILYQLMFSVFRNVGTLPSVFGDPAHSTALWFVLAACICVLLIGVLGGSVELRLHVNKTAIDSGYTGLSYLPLKLNPAGASPIMYAFSLLALPQYVAQALAALVPGAAPGTERFLSAWGISTPLGFAVYLVLLFSLTIFFGLFTVDPRAVAKRMRDGGEYFDGVMPGRSTLRYLSSRVAMLSAVSGVLLVLFTGLPLWFIGAFPELQFVLMAPQTLMILLGLIWVLREEIADTRLGTKYRFSLGTSAGTSAGTSGTSAASTPKGVTA